MLYLPIVSIGFRFPGVAVGSGRQAVVAYINIGSYYLVGIPLGVFLGWLLPSGIVVSVITNLYSTPFLRKINKVKGFNAMQFKFNFFIRIQSYLHINICKDNHKCR